MRKILIIGGGPAGLAAGVYACMAGFQALVLEKHDLPGGLCTAWNRQGYTIDGCVHFIMGSGPGSSLHAMWNELGVFDHVDPLRDFHYHRDLFDYRFADGQRLRLCTNMDALEQTLVRLSPVDARVSRSFVRAVRALDGFSPPLDLLRGLGPVARAARRTAPYLLPLWRWKNISIGDFAARFRSRELREAFSRLWYPDYNMLYILLIMSWLGQGLAGYPRFNSLGFSRLLERSLLQRGGQIQYGSRVNQILVEGGRAVGLELESGERLYGDHVIAAAASPDTLAGLLPGHPITRPGLPITPPLVHVVFGSSHDFGDYESAACGLNMELDPPIELSGEARSFLLVHIYNFVDGLAPPGRVLVKAMYPSEYQRWAARRATSRERYREAKDRAAEAVMEAMDRHFPGFSRTVEMVDVATPATFQRYTENQLGSLIAWGAVPGAPFALDRTVPGVRNLVLAGHWIMPGGGVPQAALSGRQAVQWICHQERIPCDWPASEA